MDQGKRDQETKGGERRRKRNKEGEGEKKSKRREKGKKMYEVVEERR